MAVQRGDNNAPLPIPSYGDQESGTLARLTDFETGLEIGLAGVGNFRVLGYGYIALLGHHSRRDRTSTQTAQHVVSLVHLCE